LSFPRPTTPGDPSTPQVDSSQVTETTIYFVFKPESRLLNMHDLIYYVLQASHSSQAPGPQWTGGSPTPGEPPTWSPPPSAGFWPPWGPGFWRPPVQPYPGQTIGHPPSQPAGHPPPPPSWGSPPGEYVPSPFGSPPLRSPLLQPMTSTPPTVRNYFAILTHIHIGPPVSHATRPWPITFVGHWAPTNIMQSNKFVGVTFVGIFIG
jgi:hypothetical protein